MYRWIFFFSVYSLFIIRPALVLCYCFVIYRLQCNCLVCNHCGISSFLPLLFLFGISSLLPSFRIFICPSSSSSLSFPFNFSIIHNRLFSIQTFQYWNICRVFLSIYVHGDCRHSDKRRTESCSYVKMMGTVEMMKIQTISDWYAFGGQHEMQQQQAKSSMVNTN